MNQNISFACTGPVLFVRGWDDSICCGNISCSSMEVCMEFHVRYTIHKAIFAGKFWTKSVVLKISVFIYPVLAHKSKILDKKAF